MSIVPLKGVILGVDRVLLHPTDAQTFIDEICNLLRFLKRRNVQPVVLSNRDWTVGQEPADKRFKERVFDFPWFIADRDSSVPRKPSKSAVDYVLSQMGWKAREAIYLGNDDADIQSAVNAGVLFLNAQWYGGKREYGLKFDTPKDVGRFVDVFCLRDYLWHYHLLGQESTFYALGTYGTLEERYAVISNDAREAAKFGRGHPDFWIKYLLSTVYFSGIEFDYIASYPSSIQGARPSIMEQTVREFAKCFRKNYLSDLIVRHSTAQKSAYVRASGGDVDHANQLNTIHLTELPLKRGNDRYKRNPLTASKTVLVIDDFCTRGYSLECARWFLKQLGVNTIGLSLLKTIHRGYREIVSATPARFSPFSASAFTNISYHEHPYRNYISEPETHAEIQSKLIRYDTWTWPLEIQS